MNNLMRDLGEVPSEPTGGSRLRPNVGDVLRVICLIVLAAAAAAAAAGCGGGGSDDDDTPDAAPLPPDAHVPTFDECDGTDQAYVRQSAVALLGRRPLSQDEVRVYTDLLGQVAALDEAAGGPAGDQRHAQRVVAEAMMQAPGYVDRWQEHFIDKLIVDRLDATSQQSCYGARMQPDDTGGLATQVRDGAPTGDLGLSFTMKDLVRSSLALDDVSPIYRGHLFALVSHTFDAANVPEAEAELARRADFGQRFDSAYLHRDLVCLGCHNSEFSVTDRAAGDPDDRHWPMNGFLEKALYDNYLPNPDEAHAMFRFAGFVDTQGSGDTTPWGWSPDCGSYNPSFTQGDPAPTDALFGGIRGKNTTVYDLEAMLHRGLDAIAANGLMVGPDGAIADPDQAFAWLVAATIVEGVWQEVIGTPLTVPNYFPRNEAQRDLLQTLTANFVAARFSLRTLLGDIVTSDYFNRLPPDAGCGAAPYAMPNVFDPWVIADDDPARRLNGAGDGVFPLSPRTLVSAAYGALAWEAPTYQSFPELSQCDQASCSELNGACAFGYCCAEKELYCVVGAPRPDATAVYDERYFQRGIGFFLKSTEHGFRGLDFQSRLEWEDRFGSCDKLAAASDYLDDLTALAATQGTVRDVVTAMKDRFIGDAAIDETTERPALEALFGVSLDSPASAAPALEIAARRFCGVLLASPQFMLGGIAARDATASPLLLPTDAQYDAVCGGLTTRVTGYTVSCGAGTLTVTAN